MSASRAMWTLGASVTWLLWSATAPAQPAAGDAARTAAAPRTSRSSAEAPRSAGPAESLPPLPIRVAVATEEGTPVVNEAWWQAQLREAERLLGPHGVVVRQAERRELDARFARLETARDRDALRAQTERGVINVFVVGSLRDVDDPTRFILGVRWRLLRDTSKDWVILSSIALPTTLAHELGHYFGLDHSPTDNNIMSYRRSNPSAVHFDRKQGEKMLRTARGYVRSGRLQRIVAPEPSGNTAAGCTSAR